MHGYVFQFREIFQELPMLLDGAVTTLHISILTLILSLVVGTVGALCRMSRFRWLRVPATCYVEVIRNTPLLVQLFFIYFGFSQIYIDVSNYTAGLNPTRVWSNSPKASTRENIRSKSKASITTTRARVRLNRAAWIKCCLDARFRVGPARHLPASGLLSHVRRKGRLVSSGAQSESRD